MVNWLWIDFIGHWTTTQNTICHRHLTNPWRAVETLRIEDFEDKVNIYLDVGLVFSTQYEIQ